MAAEQLAPTHLAVVLGDPPADPAGRAAWCGLAYRVETYRDRHPEALDHAADGAVIDAIGPRPGEQWCLHREWDDLADHFFHGADVVARRGGSLYPTQCWTRLVLGWNSSSALGGLLKPSP